ncbi:DNA-3-methyladenine glycosylase family protein [Paractinoplanes globisporus]|uniref:DNA-3-methyladenine glycosylase II n=1 Tax=Paractinoplanes globisporus TaxID=113565 RepID=A0ABW6WFI9_9ACTN|nr:DNA-3-methyladenine glycosylase [Actinoplanes globisporus]
MTRTGKSATKEQRAAAKRLGSLDDSLGRWVQSVGPIDAYDAHLPITVGGPLEWFSFAVTSRQLSRASSLTIYGRLVAQLGGAITAERVISTDEQTLREAGLSHQKAWTIRMLAERMHDGALEFDALGTMTDAEILTSLVAVPGIGRSSAQRFMLHYLRRPDIFPAGDPTVREAITALDQLDSLITPNAAEQHSERWHPYRSYATSYLWGYAWELHPVVAGRTRH